MFKKIFAVMLLMATSVSLFAQAIADASGREKLSPPAFMMSSNFWILFFIMGILAATVIIMSRSLSRMSNILNEKIIAN